MLNYPMQPGMPGPMPPQGPQIPPPGGGPMNPGGLPPGAAVNPALAQFQNFDPGMAPQAQMPGFQQATQPQATPPIPQPGAPPQGGVGNVQAQSQRYPPELISMILKLNEQDPRAQMVKRQQSLADKLRGQAAEGSRSTSPILTPNWAGTLAGIYQNYKAGQMDQAAQAESQKLAGEASTASKDWFEAMRSRYAK